MKQSLSYHNRIHEGIRKWSGVVKFHRHKPIHSIKATPHRYSTTKCLHHSFFLSNKKRFRQCNVTIAPHWKFSKRVHYRMYVVARNIEPRRIPLYPRLQEKITSNKTTHLWQRVCASNGLYLPKMFDVVVRYVLRLVNMAEHSYMKFGMQYIKRRTFVNLVSHDLTSGIFRGT